MKNMKFWRTALVATLVLTVMLSVTGGTIAWFADSMTSEVNTITAGNLDIELYKGTVVEGNKVTAQTPVFELPELWEPGAVAYENLVLKNEGTLHLHYTFGLNYFGENCVVVDGNTTEYSLANALKVALVENGVSGTREEVIAQAANLTALSAGEIKGTITVNSGTYTINSGSNTWYMALATGDGSPTGEIPAGTIYLNSGNYTWNTIYAGGATLGNVVVASECVTNWN